MYRNLLNWLTILLVLPSCSGTSPTISVVCEENNVGNAIIKWETAPILKVWHTFSISFNNILKKKIRYVKYMLPLLPTSFPKKIP